MKQIYKPKISTGKIIAVEYSLYEPTGSYLTTPSAVHKMMTENINHISEELHILVLNVKNAVLNVILVAKGNYNSVAISSAEILRTVFVTGGNSIIVAHQHISQDVTPSDEDVSFTSNLYKACKVVNINLLDHVIYSATEFYSFKEHKLI
jgi:DNA repair protein RadC